VRLRSSRPVAASRVFVGQEVTRAAVALPALFSVCATAQASACAQACERALGRRPSTDVARARRLLVDAETTKEHLWRVLLDWPRFLGGTSNGRAMAGVMAAFNRLRGTLTGAASPLLPGATAADSVFSAAREWLAAVRAVTDENVLGMPPARWLQRVETPEELLRWARRGPTAAACLLREIETEGWGGVGRNAVPALPAMTLGQLEGLLGGPHADRFLAAPCWGDRPAESSPLTRNSRHRVIAGLRERFGNGLLPRLAAQLVELSALQSPPRTEAASAERVPPAPARTLAPNAGLAQVEAARGRLIHRVALNGDRIGSYRILAPTEWNFHPRGTVVAGLATLPAAETDTLRRLARLFVTAVDPCVEYDVVIR
jgi:hypothetical protein